jgi:hypothetical protein
MLRKVSFQGSARYPCGAINCPDRGLWKKETFKRETTKGKKACQKKYKDR